MPITSNMAKKAGRPKVEFTPKQIAQLEDYALHGCQNNTIATLMDFDKCLIDQRPDIKKLLTKKRCERKYNLRVSQDKAVTSGNPALLIFMGKNELEQRDRQEIRHDITPELSTVLGVINGSTKGKLPTGDDKDSSKAS